MDDSNGNHRRSTWRCSAFSFICFIMGAFMGPSLFRLPSIPGGLVTRVESMVSDTSCAGTNGTATANGISNGQWKAASDRSNPTTDTSATNIVQPIVPSTHYEWCPRAQCSNSELCHPCQRRFLIVITIGRTASTTLTWMLDNLPGVRMAGENNNALGYIRQMSTNVVNFKNMILSSDKKDAWGHHAMPTQSFACAAQSMIETINPPKTVKNHTVIAYKSQAPFDIVGFKTIRMVSALTNPADDVAMVAFIKEHFPCSRIIVNINSNTRRGAASMKKANFGGGARNSTTLNGFNQRLRKIHDIFGPQQSFLIDMNQWTNNITKLNEVVSWLGFDEACHFKEHLQFNTKGGGYGNGRTKLVHRDPKCTKLAPES